MDPKKKEIRSSRSKGRFSAWIHENIDVRGLRKFFPYFFLIGVSVYVGYQMEAIYSTFQSNVKKTVYEREYHQQKAYDEIMSRIDKFDGESVEPEPAVEPDYTYKYERKQRR